MSHDNYPLYGKQYGTGHIIVSDPYHIEKSVLQNGFKIKLKYFFRNGPDKKIMQRKCGVCKAPGHTRRSCPVLANYNDRRTDNVQPHPLPDSSYIRLSREVQCLNNKLRHYKSIIRRQAYHIAYGMMKKKETSKLKLNFLPNLDPYFKTDGECPICFESFSKTDFCGLACHHQICYNCVTEISKNDEVTCPTCRVAVKEVHLPSGMSISSMNHLANVITG